MAVEAKRRFAIRLPPDLVRRVKHASTSLIGHGRALSMIGQW